MATAATERDPLDVLQGMPDGTLEQHPNDRFLFRSGNVTWQIRPVQDDPDCWIIKGTGGEYRVDVAVGSCSCRGNTHWGHCKHVDTMTLFVLARGATSKANEEEMSEEQLRALFA